ncbi:MAG: LacI family DNA-binding transcriptional regulator [Bacteroidales bacterium]|nr:LacI family DNA-binding transcriptional regulator [Bacteroidales bacterium]
MKESAKRITIKDVARLSGLSKGTVDRVLHNRGEVAKRSYDKVMKVVEELGYAPNMYASLLATAKQHVIAVVLPEYGPSDFWSLSESGLIQAEEAVGPLGVSIARISYDQYDLESFRSACRQVLESEPEGVVIAPMFKNETLNLTARLQERGIPYAFVDSKLEQDGYLAYFGTPMYKSGYLCADLLVNGQDVREAVIVRIERDKLRQSDPTVTRRSGFLDYMAEHAPDCTIHNVFIRPNDPVHVQEILSSFFQAHPEVRHIVMFNSRIHLLVGFLEQHPVPGRRVIGFDNLSGNLAALRRGTVTMLIAQHPDRQIFQAVEALSDSIVLKKAPTHRDNYMHMDILTRYNIEDY